ncbi:MAG: hypothetical protein JWO58_2584 [Chitinophagaceae bacterium]|nr:hypothetical protein [Chitinophagaceae bacterium]
MENRYANKHPSNIQTAVYAIPKGTSSSVVLFFYRDDIPDGTAVLLCKSIRKKNKETHEVLS